MGYSGIIFDFNGTLVFDTEIQEAAWRQYSTMLRGYSLTGEEFMRMHGRPTRFFLEYLMNRPLDEEEAQHHNEAKEEIYRTLLKKSDIGLAPGAEILLDHLAANRIPRTIATSSNKANVDFYFRTFRLEKWFNVNDVAYDDGTYPGKPEPYIYLKAAENLGLPPESFLVAEDAMMGIESARRAGVGFIAAIGPASSHKYLAGIPGVTQVISTYDQLDRSLFR